VRERVAAGLALRLCDQARSDCLLDHGHDVVTRAITDPVEHVDVELAAAHRREAQHLVGVL
jgi:hypothetical protein